MEEAKELSFIGREIGGNIVRAKCVSSVFELSSVALFSYLLYHFLILFVYALCVVLIGSSTVYCRVKYNFVARGIRAYRWEYFRTRCEMYFISKFKCRICYVVSYYTLSIFCVYGENIICARYVLFVSRLTVSTLLSFCLFILYMIFYTVPVYFSILFY